MRSRLTPVGPVDMQQGARLFHQVDGAMTEWHLIASAPFDHDLQLSVKCIHLCFRVAGRGADAPTPQPAVLYPSTHRTGVSGPPDDPPILAVTSVLFLRRQLCELGFVLGKQLYNPVPLRWVRLGLENFAIALDVQFNNHSYGRAHIAVCLSARGGSNDQREGCFLALRRFGIQMSKAERV